MTSLQVPPSRSQTDLSVSSLDFGKNEISKKKEKEKALEEKSFVEPQRYLHYVIKSDEGRVGGETSRERWLLNRFQGGYREKRRVYRDLAGLCRCRYEVLAMGNREKCTM